MVEVLARHGWILETTGRAGQSADESQKWKDTEGMFKPMSLENLGKQFYSLISRIGAWESSKGRKEQSQREKDPEPL